MAGLIVHEWVEKRGGSENVVDAMSNTFPEARIHCLWNDAPERFPGKTVTESWLAKTPLRRSKAAALPFMPSTWTQTVVGDQDFVLVSSHLFAHHVGGRMKDGVHKFVYVHTPARYIWAPELDRRGAHPLATAVAPVLRSIDARRAREGAEFAANSSFVKERVHAAWDRDATVIYPPVDIAQLQSVQCWRTRLTPAEYALIDALPCDFLLGASRFVPYKRLDVVIAAGEAAGLPVVLAGSGTQRAELAVAGAEASVPVTLIDSPSNAMLYALYQAATAFVFPAIEDFGIMPVEAMCLGTPSVVAPVGGAVESVEALEGGAVFESFSPASLKRGVEVAVSTNMAMAQQRADGIFGQARFSSELREWMRTQPTQIGRMT